MFGLVLGALWRRRAQAVLLFVLALVATTGAAAAPVYIVGSVQSLAAAAVDTSSNNERVVEVTTRRTLSRNPTADLASFRDRVIHEVDLPGFTTTSGMGFPVSFGSVPGRVDYREGFCDHVVIDGACPAAADEIVLQTAFAGKLGVSRGGQVSAKLAGTETPHPLRVVGFYQPVDPRDPYWGRSENAANTPPERLTEADAFTAMPTFGGLGAFTAEMSVDLLATSDAFRQRDPQLHALAFEQARARLGSQDVQVISDLRNLANRIFDDQQLIYVGVTVGAVELLLICWFALFLAVSQTARDRRGDVALLKMRGARRRDIWRLLAGQSVIPLAAGGLVGFVAGPLLAQFLSGAVQGSAIRRVLWLAVVGTTLLAVVGAVIAALIAERRMLRESVTDLGRGVVGHRRSWRSSLFDGVVVVVAVAAAYQVKAGSGAATAAAASRGVELAAPVLLTLSVGVLAARLVPVLAAGVGRAALRAGRLSLGLGALHLARRPDTSRVLGLVTVVVAVLCGTALSWSESDRARHDRAVLEVGDQHVLTVDARNPATLLGAVRKVDPDGRYAMAVVQTNSGNPVLAVDASRLGAVMPRLDAFGVDDWNVVAGALRPETMPGATVGPGALTLDATWSSPAGSPPVSVVATVQDNEAAATTVVFGPLHAGRHTYPVAQSPCASACRLVSLVLSATEGTPAVDSAATVHGLTGLSDAGLLRDRTRWRADVVSGAQIPQITAGPDGLVLTLIAATMAKASTLAAGVFVLDAPTPLPVLAGGDLDLNLMADPRARVTDGTVLPLRVAARANMLPRIRKGLVVDLEYADRLARTESTGVMQVWLSANAPDDAVTRLAGAGLRLVLDESVPDRMDGLAAQGPPAALRFLLLVASVGVLLALISFSVMAAVERRPRGEELAAMRRQGLRQAVVRRVAVGGYGVLIGASVVTGAMAAALLSVFFPPALPVFGDGWQVLAAPAAPGYLLPAAAGLVAVVLGCLAAAAAASLVSAVRHRIAEGT